MIIEINPLDKGSLVAAIEQYKKSYDAWADMRLTTEAEKEIARRESEAATRLLHNVGLAKEGTLMDAAIGTPPRHLPRTGIPFEDAAREKYNREQHIRNDGI